MGDKNGKTRLIYTIQRIECCDKNLGHYLVSKEITEGF